MSRHSEVYGDLGRGLDGDPAPAAGRGGARFLKRAHALDERASGRIEEKTLRWVDPRRCVMWAGHNRDYGLLTEERCRDLIDGIRAQGRQEFPAVVRPHTADPTKHYEVVCGARRHFAVSWLRDNGYKQFLYLVEVRDLSDEEAFRLADVENREREDISDLERARDYARALAEYYGGEQKRMAERLDVSPAWLSRYLALAKLPGEIVGAYADLADLRERHARALAPLMRADAGREAVLRAASALAEEQASRRAEGLAPLDGTAVMGRLTTAAKGQAARRRKPAREVFARGGGAGVTVERRRDRTVIELPRAATAAEARRWLAAFLDAEYGQG